MYYVVGAYRGKACIRDTKDGVSEWISLDGLRKLDKAGVSVCGISKSKIPGMKIGEFYVSPKIGSHAVIAKYKMLTGVSFKVSEVHGCLTEIDFSECRVPCLIVLDDICSSICKLKIHMSKNTPSDIRVKVGKGIFDFKDPVVSDIGTFVLDSVTFDILDAIDPVFRGINVTFSDAVVPNGRLPLGKRKLQWALESLIVHRDIRFYGSKIDGRTLEKGILLDKGLNTKFLSWSKADLLLPDKAPKLFGATGYLRRDIRSRFEVLQSDYSTFLESIRSKTGVVDMNVFSRMRVGKICLNSVWRFFYFGGDDIDIYDSFVRALMNMR